MERGLASKSQVFCLTYGGFNGHDGSGHLMCVDAGARSYRANTALLVAFDIEGTPGYYDGGLFAFVLGVAAQDAVAHLA
ncbi:hypothetical protein PZH32_04140 [Adlercreutzia equolifaciens]|uniref:hypothetical protein n=1 Tax=Adlercreutzia equolifaciens TaxID=446660 RepID=UPI0023B1A225|nr:hypothetical protein [Adlercreutzia equolifaciens]MDE8702150.1 hypothetical protein [Adlercreutzia equolifaciens]